MVKETETISQMLCWARTGFTLSNWALEMHHPCMDWDWESTHICPSLLAEAPIYASHNVRSRLHHSSCTKVQSGRKASRKFDIAIVQNGWVNYGFIAESLWPTVWLPLAALDADMEGTDTWIHRGSEISKRWTKQVKENFGYRKEYFWIHEP